MRRIEKNYSLQIRLCIGILVLSIGLFLTGTFFDKSAAEALFSPDHTIVKLITTTGVYPFHAVQVLGWGVIFQRVLHSQKSRQVRGVLCTFCVVAAVFLGYIGGRSLVSGNNLGSIFPGKINCMFLDQLDKPVQLSRNKECIDRIAEQNQVSFPKRFLCQRKIFLICADFRADI